MAPRLELFEFRYRDPRTGKWLRARYVAERHQIAARHVEYEVIGPPEIRNVIRTRATSVRVLARRQSAP